MEAKLAEVQPQAEARKAQLDELGKRIAALSAQAGVLTCDAQLPAWDNLLAGGGLLNALAQAPDPTIDPCLTPPGAGYRRLENQLYRVEVHQGGPLEEATFKWSRDNGTVVTAIERIQGSVIVVHDGPGRRAGLRARAVGGDQRRRARVNGLPGQLAQIDTVSAATREITLQNVTPVPLAATPDGVDATRHPKLRRWDQVDQATAQGIPATGEWQPLEDGISVQFSQTGRYNTGDYWLIPARTATGEIEWPPFEVPNLNPQPQPRLGIEHHLCRLALIQVQDGVIDADVTDCRVLFPPLTELPAAGARQALHIVKTNWDNDGVFPADAFTKDGLRITLDAAPDPASISNETVIVTLEMPYSAGDQTAVSPNIRQQLVLVGQVGLDPNDPNTIVWRFVEQAATPGANTGANTGVNTGANTGTNVGVNPGVNTGTNVGVNTGVNIGASPLLGLINLTRPNLIPRGPQDANLAAVVQPQAFRLRVTLKGRVIWSQAGGNLIYLDGQAFGRPAAIPGAGPRTALIFPTGDGACQ